MKIIVTAEDIAAGRQSEPSDCPIALAIARVFGERVLVCPERLMSIEPYPELQLPAKVADFINRFDDGLEVAPFEFELPLEEQWIPMRDDIRRTRDANMSTPIPDAKELRALDAKVQYPTTPPCLSTTA